jgi:two-component system NtrC family sensor kinase
MKYCVRIFFLLLPFFATGQKDVESMKNILSTTVNDSTRYNVYAQIYDFYEETNKDSALVYAEKELTISKKNNRKLCEVLSLNHEGYQLTSLGRYAEALQCLLSAFDIVQKKQSTDKDNWLITNKAFKGDNRLYMLSYTHHIFAILMWQTQNTTQEIVHFKEARRIAKEIGYLIRQQMADMNLGRSYAQIGKLDSALFFEHEAEQLVPKSGFKKYLGQIYNILGGICYSKGDERGSRTYYYKGVAAAQEQNNINSLNAGYFALSKYYLTVGRSDSSLKYAMKNLQVYQTLGTVTGAALNKGTIYQNIYLGYKLNGQLDSAYKYQGLALNTIDSLSKVRIKNLADFQNVNLNEQLRLQNVEKEKVVYENKVRTSAFIAGLVLVLLIALILYWNNRLKHKTNRVLEKTLNDLKSTQAQLVQSEKMASLGELTAGIAHEIQNPLNFVNNFAEINTELIDEMKEEAEKGNLDEVRTIANDLKDNNQKIAFHGKRAESIVKGMLQHSRSSTGKKELTDINALADEFLRLSYHGLRAKDKSFNATMETNFDYNINKIEIIPQDVGRVLLNLFNNAFYSVNEKKKALNGLYEPKVFVSTEQLDDKVQILVRDNGNGIPQKIVDKIYNPFFTTKPTGEGTGLGLSLSYDIITKGHGGELKVDTKEGEYASFKIILPR